MAEQGFPEDYIANERRAVAALLEGRYVWPDNWPIASVFQHCEWDRANAGLGGSVLSSISATEIHSVCTLLHIPPPDWPDVLVGVRMMVAAALPVLRERTANR